MPDARPPLEIDEVIQAEIGRLLAAAGRTGTRIDRSERLTEGLGITSFELAELVARLNAKLSADPFRTSLALTDVRTVEDLCRAYRGRQAGPPLRGGEDELEASLKRARARRANRRR